LDNVAVHINDIKITHATWGEHIACVFEVLCHLRINGFTVNPTKCVLAFKEIDFIGVWFIPSSPKPRCKTIDAILMMSPQFNGTKDMPFAMI
jgi:hypothetical protein